MPKPARIIAAAVMTALLSTPTLADGISREQGDAILTELKAIRALLEKQVQAPAGQRPAPPAPPQLITLPDTSGHATLGNSDAPITIVEFTDLQCPYCARFSAQTMPQLRQSFIDAGKVRFVSRNLPLSFHPFALPAAVAARCAGEQDKYWEFREQIFQRQKELADAPYDAIATELKLDMAKFAACRQDPAQTKAAEADRAAANALGITGTPTFLIGRTTKGAFTGDRLSGAQPFAVFETKINALLTAK
jgi:protein-disulfide isomerase